jgi:hypothetical protein
MYRFSINKLHQLKKDKILLHLFDYYFQKVGDLRIRQSKTMKKLPETYREAALIISSEIRGQAAATYKNFGDSNSQPDPSSAIGYLKIKSLPTPEF